MKLSCRWPTSTPPSFQILLLPLRTPHSLQQPISLRQSIQAIIALAPTPHESTQRINLVLAGVSTVLVNLADGDLNAGVVFGLDDAVGGAALAGDVAVRRS